MSTEPNLPADPLALLLQSHPETAYDYLEFRKLMAGQAAADAALRATDAEIAEIKLRLEAIEQAHTLQDPEQEAAADAAFHLAIYEAGHNLVTIQVMRRVLQMLSGDVFYDRTNLYRRRGVRDGFLRQHQALWHAIAARNPEAACSLAEAHIVSTEEALREAQHAEARREIALRRRAGSDLVSRPRANKERGSDIG
jgi:GntR family transcriptional repressor for pyruvate dehydrogenase complex